MKIKYKVKKIVWVPCTLENAIVGATVKSGPNWYWGEQGQNQEGVIITNPVKTGDGSHWIDIKWADGAKNGYRVEPVRDLLIKLKTQ